jgi:hypothetical protein
LQNIPFPLFNPWTVAILICGRFLSIFYGYRFPLPCLKETYKESARQNVKIAWGLWADAALDGQRNWNNTDDIAEAASIAASKSLQALGHLAPNTTPMSTPSRSLGEEIRVVPRIS